MTKKRWSLEEEQILLDMKYERKSYVEISVKLGRTVDQCRNKYHQLLKEYRTPKFYEKCRKVRELGLVE